MAEEIRIADLSPIEKLIAMHCDDGDGILKVRSNGYDEVSVFNEMKANINEIFENRNIDGFYRENYVCPQDAIQSKKPIFVEKTPTKIVSQASKYKPIENLYKADSPFWPEEKLDIDIDVFNEALNAILPEGSVLKDKGKVFVEASSDVSPGKRTQPSDPFLLVGISMHESACGMSKMAKDSKRNNIAGLAGKNFENVDSCINTLAGTIDHDVNVRKLSTVVKLAYSGKYCAKSSGPTWSKAVPKFAEQLRNKYNELLLQKQQSM